MKKLLLILLSLQCSLQNISLAQQPGDLDYVFNGGYVSMSNDRWYGVSVQFDNKVIAVGKNVVRYNTDGTLDGTFGTGGIVATGYSCKAVAIQSDGKIVVVGAGQGDLLVQRYNADGSPDSTFDSDGLLLTDIASGSDDHGHAIEIQGDGKLVIASSAGTTLAICRYNSDGSLDGTFGVGGKLMLNGGTVDSTYAWHDPAYTKVQTDGKILAGSAHFLVRLNPDGTYDNSFGTNGLVTFTGSVSDLAIRPDGKILLASYGVIRLNTDGGVDSSYGFNGYSISNLQWGDPHYNSRSIALQPDGKVLVGGYMHGNLQTWRDFSLERYTENGLPDSSFSFDGRLFTEISGFEGLSESHACAITPDMKIVLAGCDFASVDQGFLVKYNLGWIGWPANVNTISGNNVNLIVSPNPAFDQINIEASEIENGSWHLDLRDVTGRQILQEQVLVTNGVLQKNVSIKDLPAGLYMLRLDNGKMTTMTRLVKIDN